MESRDAEGNLTPGPNRYVPILKLKRGEKVALGAISAGLRSGIIPLFEIVERTDKSLHEHLSTAFAGLPNHMKGYARCFLDAREIEADGHAGAAEAFARAAGAGISFTPVTGVSRDTDVTAALAHGQRGLALRLTRPEFERGVFPAGIESFLYQHSVTADGVDLIVDLGAVEDMISDGVATLTRAFLQTVPNHAHWRTFTVSACAFPLTMGIVDAHCHELVERTDWISWKENLYNRRSELVRLPSFGDCVIQHPRGVEGFDPRTMSVSASIRYARENDWLLIKGESTRLTPAVVQFPELATRLVYGHLRPFFLASPVHCAGCEAMQRAADGAPGYGAPEVWRRLGTIHHMSLVMQKLDSLAWP